MIWYYIKALVKFKLIQLKYGKLFTVWFAIRHPDQYFRFKMLQSLMANKQKE